MTRNGYENADLSVLEGMDDHRPWQLEMIGAQFVDVLSRESCAYLRKLFDYRPDIGAVTIQSEHGDVIIKRDFPSHQSEAVDNLIASIFHATPSATGLVLHMPAETHTATTEAPYASAIGEGLAAIRGARERGEISIEESIQRMTDLAKSHARKG